MEVTKETVSGGFQGHTTVGTTAVQIAPISGQALKGVLLKCPGITDDEAAEPAGNTTPVFIGLHTNVTADKNSQTGGFPIPPGGSMFIPIEDASRLHAVSSGSGQDIAWMVV